MSSGKGRLKLLCEAHLVSSLRQSRIAVALHIESHKLQHDLWELTDENYENCCSECFKHRFVRESGRISTEGCQCLGHCSHESDLELYTGWDWKSMQVNEDVTGVSNYLEFSVNL